MLPVFIQKQIEEHLQTKIARHASVYGGDINKSARVELEDRRELFVKWNHNAPENMFQTEAKGLGLLQKEGTSLIIPDVLLQKDEFLVLEWINEGGGQQHTARDFGRALAALHKNTQNQFGLDHDNYIGRLHQSNNLHGNWPDFFAIERIEPQIKMGVESGKLNRNVLRQVQNLYKKLGSLFPTEPPALIHGDLWSGNYMFTKNGETSIYDPAVYYGHREMEIAMTRLFGGFSANFYEGYNEAYPLAVNFNKRVRLCNLYPILVHANLFGGSYCSQAESIIQEYA